MLGHLDLADLFRRWIKTAVERRQFPPELFGFFLVGKLAMRMVAMHQCIFIHVDAATTTPVYIGTIIRMQVLVRAFTLCVASTSFIIGDPIAIEFISALRDGLALVQRAGDGVPKIFAVDSVHTLIRRC